MYRSGQQHSRVIFPSKLEAARHCWDNFCQVLNWPGDILICFHPNNPNPNLFWAVVSPCVHVKVFKYSGSWSWRGRTHGQVEFRTSLGSHVHYSWCEVWSQIHLYINIYSYTQRDLLCWPLLPPPSWCKSAVTDTCRADVRYSQINSAAVWLNRFPDKEGVMVGLGGAVRLLREEVISAQTSPFQWKGRRFVSRKRQKDNNRTSCMIHDCRW